MARVALEMQRAGRIVWRGLTLRCGCRPTKREARRAGCRPCPMCSRSVTPRWRTTWSPPSTRSGQPRRPAGRAAPAGQIGRLPGALRAMLVRAQGRHRRAGGNPARVRRAVHAGRWPDTARLAPRARTGWISPPGWFWPAPRPSRRRWMTGRRRYDAARAGAPAPPPSRPAPLRPGPGLRCRARRFANALSCGWIRRRGTRSRRHSRTVCALRCLREIQTGASVQLPAPRSRPRA